MKKAIIKATFLREVSRKLKLKTEIFQENVFEVKKIRNWNDNV